ncbi:MAG TPA: STM4014 family protein [Polyangia bacterium]|nr:STM4014 family protein [Polyangia bacterium]
MSAQVSVPRFVLIGNPENRRVTLFQAALARQGLAPATVVAWRALVDDPRVLAALPATPAFVRIDSAGEDDGVERAFLARGYADARAAGVATIAPAALAKLAPSRGRILCPRQAHLGFLRVLDDVAAVLAARPRWRVLNPPAEIAALFDKRETWRRYNAFGIPVPPALEPTTDPDALRAAMRARGWRSVYVKLSCGSSASCLAIYQAGQGGTLMTTIEQARDGWFNSLRVRVVRAPERVAEILAFLLREGSQVELNLPKARLDNRYFDTRVLVIAGQPAFTVVRTSTHPITNLHLGGRRGDPDALRAAAPDAVDAAMETCARVAAAHPGALHVGVDLMYTPRFKSHAVLEANAFGDLLPNLTRDGLDVYEWQIRAALAQESSPRPR